MRSVGRFDTHNCESVDDFLRGFQYWNEGIGYWVFPGQWESTIGLVDICGRGSARVNALVAA